MALCNDMADAQGVLSYSLLLSYSPWYLITTGINLGGLIVILFYFILFFLKFFF